MAEESNVHFLPGRLFFRRPPDVSCPDCKQSNMHVLSLATLTEKWGRKTDTDPKKEKVRGEIRSYLKAEFSTYDSCTNGFHGFFVDPGPGQMEELLNLIPAAIRRSNPGFRKAGLTGGQRGKTVEEYLEGFRNDFLKPVLDRLGKTETIRLGLSPRHLLFDAEDKEKVVDSRRFPHRRSYPQSKRIEDVIPIMPSYLVDNSDWVGVSRHFKAVLILLRDVCQRTSTKRVAVFFGSGNINIRSWLYALNQLPLDDDDKGLLDFIAGSDFHDWMHDPKSQQLNETDYLEGYHWIPSRPREVLFGSQG